MAELQNPYAAHQNISGRWGRVFEDGIWLANATGVSYNVEVEHESVKRAGTLWSDEKEIGVTGSGSLSVDYVHSGHTKRIIGWINGANPTRRYPSYTLSVNLEDGGTIGIEFDDAGNAVAGHESVTLLNVKFWSLPGGYEDGMVTREYDFTFSGISLDSEIVDSATLDIDTA